MPSFGMIAKTSLLKADLPFDVEHTELAKNYANNNIQELWYKSHSKTRNSWDQIVTVVSATEYVVNKLCDDFVKFSFRGPEDNSRYLQYLAEEEFFRLIRDQEDSSGTPYVFTDGQVVGVDAQLTVSSTLQVYSSLANKTSGTVHVIAGSQIVKGTGTVFNSNDVGLCFRNDADDRSYKIGKVNSATEIVLDEKYRGLTNATATYKVGDVGVKCNVNGFVGGQLQTEEIELDGENIVTGLLTFSSVNSCSKETRTGGRVYFRNSTSTGNVIATLAPWETEIERKTIVIYPKPATSETLKYRFFMKHPRLWLDSDRLLILEKYHRLVENMTTIDLLEWSGKEITAKLASDLTTGKAQMENDANDTYLEDTLMQDSDAMPLGNYYERDLDLYGKTL